MDQQSDEGAAHKKMKPSTEEADRLSDLPDFLIQYILSFLPATRDAIRTGVLSKRWQNQWRQVPVLSFHHLRDSDSRNIDQVLNQYERSNIEKFQISVVPDEVVRDLCIDYKIRFAISRDVKELILEFNVYGCLGSVRLPESLFGHTCLVKLQLRGCTLPERSVRVNWKHLKELSARDCSFPDQAIQDILSRSPLLESLNVEYCKVRVPAIASESLRKLMLVRFADEVMLSCPNIEELHLRRYYPFGFADCNRTTLCGSVRLTRNREFFVDCKSLKKLVLENLKFGYAEISCPKLEELELEERVYPVTAVKAVNVQSLNCVTLNFKHNRASVIEEFLAQLEHVKKLKLGRIFIMWLEVETSNTDVFSHLLSNLRIVRIVGLSRKDRYHKGALTFVELVLKNARMLEKLALNIQSSNRDFVSEVSRKMSSVPWCSQNATVELSYRGKQGRIKELIPRGAVL